MKTFWVQTLGCKVNHYEGEQIACLLRARGLVETGDPARADLRVINSCSVTTEAAGKSRQTTRRLVRLPLLTSTPPGPAAPAWESGRTAVVPSYSTAPGAPRPRVIVTGCWATSDPSSAGAIAGVDAVLTHHGDVAAELDRLLLDWRKRDATSDDVPHDLARKDCSPATCTDATATCTHNHVTATSPPEPYGIEGWMNEAGSPAGAATDARTLSSKADLIGKVNAEVGSVYAPPARVNAPSKRPAGNAAGTTRLPLLGERQAGRQRAVLKVQDGCDAHCTYCIIPRLRPTLWSRPVEDVVEEARRMVAAGHVELVLTGIFLGAYGRPTALRRRRADRGPGPLGELVEALCIRVSGLRRLRLPSLEPGDMTDGLLAVLRGHAQVVPHFHLPLQSGSDLLLRRMNRQYGRDDFLRMVDRVHDAFDRPALTTDVIVGFPGETEKEFNRTVGVVDHARFIHVHAFPFSPRPGTAAARWGGQFVRGPVVNERMEVLRRRADRFGLEFRRQFVGEVVEVLVEHDDRARHGRCERYFDIHFDDASARPGDFLRVRVDGVTPRRTFGTVVGRADMLPVAPPAPAGEAG